MSVTGVAAPHEWNGFPRATAAAVILALAMLSSCAWNKAFLEPQVIPATARTGRSIDPITKDTLVLQLSGPYYQPTFSDARGQPLPLPFLIESILFGDQDKLLHGWMLKDTAESTATRNTMLFLHGNGGNVLTEYPVVIPFLKKGFQVFIFDYGGYGLSQGKATRDHVEQDAITALRYVKTREDVMGTKVVLYGQSLGGHTAALVAGTEPSLIDAVVIEGGFSSFRKIAEHSTKMGMVSVLLVKEGPRACEALGRYHGPLLIVHSADDDVVPISLGRELFDSGNEPKVFMEITGAHCDGPQKWGDRIVDQLVALMQHPSR